MPDEDDPNLQIHHHPQRTPSVVEREPSTGAAAPPFSLHHGSGIADSTTSSIVPPALTPETTTRSSVSLGLLSSIWNSSSASTRTTNTSTSTSVNPSLTTTAVATPSEPSTTFTGSTLPPPPSAALRALNAPAFHTSNAAFSHKTTKSTSSQTSTSTQPVVVRTYSGVRHSSRTPNRMQSPHQANMPSSSAANTTSSSSSRTDTLPSVDDFAFTSILRAVDPEIRDAIDAIAEICARSRLSLADEYDAHLPPQGEIVNAGLGGVGWGSTTFVGRPSGATRLGRVPGGWAAENTLTAVPEASSSSERLAGSRGSVVSRGSGGKNQSAYGSLKSVISAELNSSNKNKRKLNEGTSEHTTKETSDHNDPPNWIAAESRDKYPTVTLVTTPTTSRQLSHELSSTLNVDSNTRHHRRQTSLPSFPSSKPRPATLSSLSSWMPWARTAAERPSTAIDSTKAEAKLREMLAAAR